MSATTKLIGSLEDTQDDVDELRPYVVDLDDGLNSVISGMEEVKTISDNLSTLDDDLGTVGLVLTALSPVPMVGNACSLANKPVGVLKKGIHPVRVKANQLEAKVKPLREKLQKVEDKVALAIEKLDQLKKMAKQFENTLDTTYTCLQKKKATKLITAEDKFSKGVRPAVVQLNKLLTRTTQLAKGIEDKLSDFRQLCKMLTDVGNPIDDVMSKLSGLSKLLDPIEDALNQKISVPYKVKVKGKWYQPWKWKVSTTNFSFRVKDILDGVGTGISWVNDQLMRLARKALNALDLDLPEIPGIPGLDKLEGELDQVLGFIGQFGVDLDGLSADFDGLTVKLNALEVSIKGFDIKC